MSIDINTELEKKYNRRPKAIHKTGDQVPPRLSHATHVTNPMINSPKPRRHPNCPAPHPGSMSKFKTTSTTQTSLQQSPSLPQSHIYPSINQTRRQNLSSYPPFPPQLHCTPRNYPFSPHPFRPEPLEFYPKPWGPGGISTIPTFNNNHGELGQLLYL